MSRRKILSWELAKHKGHSLRLMEYATDEDGKSEPGVSLYCARCDRGEAEELLFIPEDSWLISAFWQYTQRKLQREKKIVPDPRQPLRGRSSPWWGP